MSRFTPRISRALLPLLGGILLIGAVCVGFKQHHNHAVANIAPAVAQADTPIPATIQTPASTTEPSTQPDVDVTQAIPASEVLQPLPATMPEDTSLVTQAQGLVQAGNLLQAREMLNDALQSGRLNDSDAASTRSQIATINQTMVFSHQHFVDDPYGGTYLVQPGDNMAKIANEHDMTWEMLSRINGIDPKHLRVGATIKVIQGPFFGVVNKRAFTIDIYLGGLPGEKSSMYVVSYPVGLGRDDSTPTGTWMIELHHKLKHPTYYSPRGEGVIVADDPKNPLGGYWIGLTGNAGEAVGKMSYGIHGTIDPDSIGKQSSMGCIRLRADDIAMVYDMMVEGKSMVVIKD